MGCTIRDIAKETGLSIATVSKCINGKSVKPENRQLIEDAITKLRYLSDGTARAMRTQSTRLVVIIIPTLTNVMIPEIVSRCEALLIENGYYPVLCVTHGDAEMEKKYILKFASHHIDGIISMPSCTDVDIYRTLDANCIPYVFFEQTVLGMDANIIHLSGEYAIEEMTIAVRSAGHKNGGVIFGQRNNQAFQRRFARLKSIINKYGYHIPNEQIEYTDATVMGGRIAMNKLLALPDRPTVVFCLGEELTVGAFNAIKQNGLRIPEDMALIGIRNTNVLDAISPDLTVSALREPTEKLAEACVRRLMDLIEMKKRNEDITSNRIHEHIQLEFVPGQTI